MNEEVNNTDPRKDNIRLFRRIFNMTQKAFLEYFMKNSDGKLAMSVATFSNLESKGGARITEIVDAVCGKLALDRDVFALDSQSFAEKVDTYVSEHKEIGIAYGYDSTKGNIDTLVNRLTDYFAGEMLEGRLHRRDQIPSDREIAKMLGVGRSAVREALKVLDVMGMIDIRFGQGTYLTTSESNFFTIPLSWSMFLDGEQIDSILEIRGILEQKSAELAACCSDEVKLSRLSDIYFKMQSDYENKDLTKILDDDIEFHSSIAECSGNQIIYSMLQTIRNLMKRISGTGMVDKNQVYDIFAEHRKIYGAIILHDKELAVEAMKDHLEKSSDRYQYS